MTTRTFIAAQDAILRVTWDDAGNLANLELDGFSEIQDIYPISPATGESE